MDDASSWMKNLTTILGGIFLAVVELVPPVPMPVPILVVDPLERER